MSILRLLLFALGIGCCIAGFLGHSQAYSHAALCFFAAIILTVRLSIREKKRK